MRLKIALIATILHTASAFQVFEKFTFSNDLFHNEVWQKSKMFLFSCLKFHKDTSFFFVLISAFFFLFIIINFSSRIRRLGHLFRFFTIFFEVFRCSFSFVLSCQPLFRHTFHITVYVMVNFVSCLFLIPAYIFDLLIIAFFHFKIWKKHRKQIKIQILK